MTSSPIAHQRLIHQYIAQPTFERPSDVVHWMGFVQAQDYLGALWAVGLRMHRALEADIEQALAERSIVRTWPARGTLHFVAAADVRWMLALLAPRVIAGSAGRYRQLALEDDDFARSRKLLSRALQGGKALAREAMYQVLESGHISTAGQRGIHILGRLAQEGLICFGARAGKQQTFVLLDEWIPATKPIARDEALSKLAQRYFTSHGPATLQDFVWWSGLTVADARNGIELAKPHLAQMVIADQTYWLSSTDAETTHAASHTYLLPAFDEYLVGYRVRDAVLDPTFVKQVNAGGGILSPTIVVHGQVVGTWKRILKKDSVIVTPSLFRPLKKSEQRALDDATARYGDFLGLPATLTFT